MPGRHYPRFLVGEVCCWNNILSIPCNSGDWSSEKICLISSCSKREEGAFGVGLLLRGCGGKGRNGEDGLEGLGGLGVKSERSGLLGFVLRSVFTRWNISNIWYVVFNIDSSLANDLLTSWIVERKVIKWLNTLAKFWEDKGVTIGSGCWMSRGAWVERVGIRLLLLLWGMFRLFLFTFVFYYSKQRQPVISMDFYL